MHLGDFHCLVKRCLLHIKLLHGLNGADITAHPFGYDIAKVIGYKQGGSAKPFTGDLFGFNYNGTNYYYIRNGQNDIIGILDSTGTQVVSYQYDTWGKLLGISGSQASGVGTLNPFRYRGYYYDTETGLFYVASRYYDPSTGRFLNADSVAGSVGDLLGANVFAYCRNNPVMMIDPSGHWSLFNTFFVCLAVTVLIVCILQPELIPLAAAALAEYGSAIAAGIGIGGMAVEEALQEAEPTIQEAIPEAQKVGSEVVSKAGGGLPAVENEFGELVDGAKIPTSKVLDAAQNFLKEGYNDLGKGRFQSADLTRQVRMGDSDILGLHAGGPHVNFETLVPNAFKAGKMVIDKSIHIFLDD
jgi:RHS repeat-associated protein